jgi:hypothetical protein
VCTAASASTAWVNTASGEIDGSGASALYVEPGSRPTMKNGTSNHRSSSLQ